MFCGAKKALLPSSHRNFSTIKPFNFASLFYTISHFESATDVEEYALHAESIFLKLQAVDAVREALLLDGEDHCDSAYAATIKSSAHNKKLQS